MLRDEFELPGLMELAPERRLPHGMFDSSFFMDPHGGDLILKKTGDGALLHSYFRKKLCMLYAMLCLMGFYLYIQTYYLQISSKMYFLIIEIKLQHILN